MGNPAAGNPLAGHRQRLRQRFLRGGIAALNDYEVLELILSGAIPRRDVKPIAKALIERFGSVEAVLDATGNDLLDTPGLGPSGATALLLIRQMNLEGAIGEASLALQTQYLHLARIIRAEVIGGAIVLLILGGAMMYGAVKARRHAR